MQERTRARARNEKAKKLMHQPTCSLSVLVGRLWLGLKTLEAIYPFQNPNLRQLAPVFEEYQQVEVRFYLMGAHSLHNSVALSPAQHHRISIIIIIIIIQT